MTNQNLKPMKKKLLINLVPILRRKTLYVTAFLIMIAQTALFAQNINVKGTVKSSDGTTMPGVSVVVKGTTTGTTTSIDGKFSVSAPAKGTLSFSFIGFETAEIPVEGRTQIDVTLKEAATNLSEVVVMGYGTQQKKDVTGAVAVVSSKELKDRPNTQFGYSLEGKAAGVQVIRSSGQPQAGFSIRVRGTSSITSGSDPIYIVDGVQTYNTNEINPSDIESFTVLKDASSAAIYGSSGANGVVLITTKRGKDQKLKLDFNTSLTVSQAWKKMDVLNGSQFKDLAIEMGETDDAEFWNKYNKNTNWQDEIFRNALSQNYQLSATGGTKKTTYYFSGSWVDQNGIVLNNSVKRATFKANIDHQLTKVFKIGTSLSYDHWADVSVPENDRNGVITRLFTSIPNIGIWDPDQPEMYARSPFINDLENPVSTVYQPEQLYTNDRFHGNAYIEAGVTDGLKIKSLLGFEKTVGLFESFQDSVQTRYGKSMSGIAGQQTYKYDYWVSENTINYTKKISDHNIALLGGFIVSREITDNVWRSSHDFSQASNGNTDVGSGAVQSIPSPYYVQKSHVSYIGRVNYSYKDKYYITSNFRADGSGQFSPENRWGYFPSFSTGWRVSQEGFLKDNSVISELKLRAGWGIVGNDRAAPYAWYGIVDTISNKYLIGGETHTAFTPSTLENSALRWEKTSQLDIGFDLAILDNRLSLTADYYYKKTEDLLLEVPQPTSTGYSTALQNAGSIENRGFEFQVSSRNIVNSDFRWNTDFNISINKNKVLSIVGNTIHSGAINPAGSTFYTAVVQEGQPLGSFYGKISQGVDPATGDIKFLKTASGEEDSTAIIGDANPKFIYGLTNSFTYKNWTLDFFLQGVQGNKILNATRILTESMALTMNQAATVLNRWQNPGDVTDMPRVTPTDWANSNPSTRYIENGSYLRIKALTLGYTINPAALSRLHITRFMVYFTAENLLTFTKYTGFDPEVSAFSGNSNDATSQNTALGVDYGTYPQSRDYVLGLKISF
jgi:TonB-linked SusC/RagA family outer membrane protein